MGATRGSGGGNAPCLAHSASTGEGEGLLSLRPLPARPLVAQHSPLVPFLSYLRFAIGTAYRPRPWPRRPGNAAADFARPRAAGPAYQRRRWGGPCPKPALTFSLSSSVAHAPAPPVVQWTGEPPRLYWSAMQPGPREEEHIVRLQGRASQSGKHGFRATTYAPERSRHSSKRKVMVPCASLLSLPHLALPCAAPLCAAGRDHAHPYSPAPLPARLVRHGTGRADSGDDPPRFTRRRATDTRFSRRGFPVYRIVCRAEVVLATTRGGGEREMLVGWRAQPRVRYASYATPRGYYVAPSRSGMPSSRRSPISAHPRPPSCTFFASHPAALFPH